MATAGNKKSHANEWTGLSEGLLIPLQPRVLILLLVVSSTGSLSALLRHRLLGLWCLFRLFFSFPSSAACPPPPSPPPSDPLPLLLLLQLVVNELDTMNGLRQHNIIAFQLLLRRISSFSLSLSSSFYPSSSCLLHHLLFPSRGPHAGVVAERQALHTLSRVFFACVLCCTRGRRAGVSGVLRVGEWVHFLCSLLWLKVLNY